MRGSWLVGLVVGAVLAGGCGSDGTGSQDAGADEDAVAAGDALRQQDGSGQQGQHDGGGQQDSGGQQQDSGGQQQDSGGASCVLHRTPSTSPASSMAGRTNCKGCHANFTVAGTLFNAASGGSAVGSATVRVKNSTSGAVQVELVTDSAGLFYTSQAVTFPASIEISSCPDLVTMTAAPAGACTKSGCHTSGSQIHLP